MKNLTRVILYASLMTALPAWSQSKYQGHGADSVSAESLKKYAPPALTPTLANQIRKMLDISSPGMGMLSPDNKKLYFTWRVTGQSQIWMIDGPRRFPKQLTSGNDSVSISEMAKNGEFLILSKDVNGQENPGIFRLNLKTSLLEELFRKEKVQASASFLTDDSQYIYFTANDQKPDSYNIYKMKLADKTIETVYQGDGVWAVADQKNNGEKLLLVKYRGGMINEYYDYTPATKEMVPLIGQGESNEYTLQYGAVNGEYVGVGVQDNFRKLFRFKPAAKDNKINWISPKDLKWDVESASIDEKRQRVLYSVNRGGYTELFALNAKTFKPIALPQFKLSQNMKPDHVIAGTTSRDGTTTMLGIISAQSPRVSYSYNWNTKQLIEWVLPSAPEVDLSQFAISELIDIEARDGTKIPAFVRFPKGCKESKNCNVVVHFHGGPEAQSTAGFSVYAQSVINAGFIFVEPNVRGSDGYGKIWVDMDNGPKRESVITDIEDVSVWIKKNWKNTDSIAPKVGVMGWSYGGYSTLVAMTRFAGSYDAGVALVGMSNLVTFLMNTAPYRRILRISEYGDPEKDLEALKKLSPINYVDQVKSPLMIIQGANDPRVPAGEAIQIHETLQKKKIKSELIIFADEGHGSSKKENQVLEIGHIINFFQTHLK